MILNSYILMIKLYLQYLLILKHFFTPGEKVTLGRQTMINAVANCHL